GEAAEGAEANEAELLVFEDHRVALSPAHVGEHLQVDEVDLGAEWAGEAPRQREQAGQDREVLGGERVAARAEDVEPLPITEEDRGLVLAHDELGAPLDVARALLGIR